MLRRELYRSDTLLASLVVPPDFLIIGAARSGTSSLARELGRHSQIRFSYPKEPHFLALHGSRPRFRGPGDDEMINRQAVTEEHRWRELFQPGGHWRWGEGSVSTLYYGSRSVEAIERFCPNVRMIVILRPPAERAYSAHQYVVSRGWERESFERALTLEDERIAAGYHHIWHYRRMGFYGAQIGPFIERFGRERLLVLDHAEYERSPAAVLAECVQFIGVNPGLPAASGERINEGGQRPRALVRLEQGLRSNEAAFRMTRQILPSRLRSGIRRIGRTRAQLDSEVGEELNRSYADDLAELSMRLGDVCPAWARQSHAPM